MTDQINGMAAWAVATLRVRIMDAAMWANFGHLRNMGAQAAATGRVTINTYVLTISVHSTRVTTGLQG